MQERRYRVGDRRRARVRFSWLCSLGAHGLALALGFLLAAAPREGGAGPNALALCVTERASPCPRVDADWVPPEHLPPPDALELEPAPEPADEPYTPDALPDALPRTRQAKNPAAPWASLHVPLSAARAPRARQAPPPAPPLPPVFRATPPPQPAAPRTHVQGHGIQGPRAVRASGARAPGASAAPLRVLYAPDARQYYPAAARRAGRSGTVLVRLTIDAAGRVLDTAVVRSSGDRALDEAARALARAYRFSTGSGIRRTRLPVVFQLTAPRVGMPGRA